MQNEKFYDEEIAPELARLAKLCSGKDMSFLAVVEYTPGELARSTMFTEDVDITMRLLKGLVLAGGNIDVFLIALIRSDINCDDSVAIRLMTGAL